MSIGVKIARFAVLAFSVTLLTWYVVYSQHSGSYFNESRNIISPAKIAEARQYEKKPGYDYTRLWLSESALKGPVSDFFRPLFRLLTPLTINEPPQPPLPQDFRFGQNDPLPRPSLQP